MATLYTDTVFLTSSDDTRDLLAEESPSSRLMVSMLVGATFSTLASGICWISGTDPLGGASLSLHSLQAAAIGCAAAVPVMALKHLLWSDAVRRRFSAVDAMCSSEQESLHPVIQGMSGGQIAGVAAAEVVGHITLAFPAAQTSLTQALLGYTSLFAASPEELPPPNWLAWGATAPILAVVITSLVSGYLKRMEVGEGDADATFISYACVSTQSANADAVRAGSMTAAAADAADRAFLAVSVAWLADKRLAGVASGLFCVGYSLWLSGLWWATHDLSAPLVAGLLVTGLEFRLAAKASRRHGLPHSAL